MNKGSALCGKTGGMPPAIGGIHACGPRSHQSPQMIQEDFYGLGKNLVLFPDDAPAGFQTGRKGAKAQSAATGIDQPVEAERVSQPFVYQQGCVVDQVIGSHDVKAGDFPLHPLGQIGSVPPLMGDDQRLIPQIFRTDRFLLGQTALPAFLSCSTANTSEL